MFETKEFRRLLETEIEVERLRNDMSGVEGNVVHFLQFLAISNEAVLMEREFKKVGVPIRGVPDALQSVGDLIGDASRYARMDGRKVIRTEDVQAALTLRFCKVWPFCK